ncbi:zinc ribbon domain-containing protein [bacterium]|nr:zinc ribbon domain-containing protein [bacterium]
MPTYTYKCSVCEHTFDVFHGIKEGNTRTCPECQGEASRIISGGVGLIFKGSGFYITDYKGKNGSLNGNGNGDHSHSTSTDSTPAKSTDSSTDNKNGTAKKVTSDTKKSEKQTSK